MTLRRAAYGRPSCDTDDLVWTHAAYGQTTRRHPRTSTPTIDEHAVKVAGAEHEAAGVKAVMVSLRRGLESMGAVRTAAALARLNQRHGFDCPGCAWPEEHGGRKLAEFCENGAKAVAEEATKRVVTPEFFARHSIADLDGTARVLAVPAGPAHPPDGAAPRRRPLPADRLGRRLPVDRRRTPRAGQPERGGVLHVGAHQQ